MHLRHLMLSGQLRLHELYAVLQSLEDLVDAECFEFEFQFECVHILVILGEGDEGMLWFSGPRLSLWL